MTVAKHPTPTFRVLDKSRSVHKQMPLTDIFQLEMVGTEAAEEAFAAGGMAAALEVLVAEHRVFHQQRVRSDICSFPL